MLSVNKYLVLLLFLTSFLHVSVFSQKIDIQNIEQVTLVTDRSLYLSGEPIWFSAKYTIPEDTSVMLSKVLYVELFNNENKVITSQKIPIVKEVITGQLMIPEQSTSGYYILRAYTRYQENFPSWQMTSVILSVVNPNNPLPSSTYSQVDEQVAVASMADGYLAFSIEEPMLSEIDSVKLFVNEIQVYVPEVFYSNGLGRFNHKVVQNDKVQLLIKLKSGDTVRSRTFSPADFPVEVIVKPNFDELELKFSNVSFADKEFQVSIENLLGRQSVKQKIYLVDSKESTRFPLSKTGKGLLLVSVNDNSGKSIFEFFYYVEQKSNLNSDVISDSIFFPGDSIYIDLADFDPDVYPLTVSLVMHGTHSSESSLLPKYLINNPLYVEGFLTNNLLSGKQISDQLEIVLALRRQKLLQVIHNHESKQGFVVPELYGLTVQGKLTNPDNNEPLPNELIYCSLLGDQHQFHATISSSDGSFVIPLHFLNNQQDLYMGTNSTQENASVITISDGFCTTPPVWTPSPMLLDTSYKDLITQMYINHQVDNTFSINRIETQDVTTYSQPVFGNNLKQIKLADYIQLTTIQEVFNEIIPNIRVRERDNHFDLVVFDDDLNLKYYNPLVLIDQVPYNDIDKLMELQATQIEQIDVSSHVYAYGNNLFKGIVIITTNTGNFAGLPLSKGGVFVEYETLKPDIQFVPFSSSQNTSGQPDFANTVYWESINSGDMVEQIVITAPSSIANYELFLISLKNQSKIVGSKKIKVGKKPLGY